MSADHFITCAENYGNIVICEQPRFAYIKLAKTAGSSIKHCLKSQFPIIDSSHSDYRNRIADFFSRGRPFTFASIRNPYDRFGSMYGYLKNHHQYPKVNSALEFASIVSDVLKRKIEHGGILCHCLRLSDAAYRQSERMYDDLIRYESLQVDFNAIMRSVGGEEMELPVIEQSERDPDLYDGQIEEAVFGIYEPDFENFQYLRGDRS